MNQKNIRRLNDNVVIIGIVMITIIMGVLIGITKFSIQRHLYSSSNDATKVKTGYRYFSPEGFCRTFKWYGGYYPVYTINDEEITFLCHNGKEITYQLYETKDGWVVETPPTLVEDMKSQSYFWYDCDFDNGHGSGQIFYDLWVANDAYRRNYKIFGFGNPEENIVLVENEQGWYSLHLGNTILDLGKYDIAIASDDGAMLVSAQALSQLVYNHTLPDISEI